MSQLDAALRRVPAAQARELREQITAHLDDALPLTPTMSRSPPCLADSAHQQSLPPMRGRPVPPRWKRLP